MKPEEKLIELFNKGIVDNNLFNIVMKSNKVNTDLFLDFLNSTNQMVKICTIKLLGKHRQDLFPLVEVLNQDNNNDVMECVIRVLGDRNQYAECMSKLLKEDSALLNLIIEYLERTDKKEYLTALLFSDNNQLVDYIQKKVNGEKHG